MSECLDRERKDYPRLEALAHQVLGDLGHEYRRGSFCEDSGRPRAFVHVSVYDWESRREARRALRAAGLSRERGVPVFTVDGLEVRYAATASALENRGRQFVALTFLAPL